MSFLSHISRRILGNGLEGAASYFDTAEQLPVGTISAEAYTSRAICWRVLAKRLDWRSFAWAPEDDAAGIGTLDLRTLQGYSGQTTGEAAVLETWAAAVGLERLPAPIGWALLLIDTALVMRWAGSPLDSASPPSLDAYPRYPAYPEADSQAMGGNGEGGRPSHHPAWLPLALQMALTGEESASVTVFPFNMLVSSPSASSHFRLSSQVKWPPLPPPSDESRAVARKLAGLWELTSMTNDGKPFPGGAKGRIFYSKTWYSAQVTGLKGLWHFVYSGRWHMHEGRVYHVCYCNSPMACFEARGNRCRLWAGSRASRKRAVLNQVLQDSQLGLEASDASRQSYGGVRMRGARANSNPL